MNDLAVRESFQPRQSARLDREEIKFIANTEFVPAALRGNLPALFAAIATGRELGLGDMAAIRGIHVIDGRPTLSAETMVALVRRAGHSIVGGVEPGVARVTGTRGDNGDTMTCEWTSDMAERAGLASKGNWRKYEESMLWARAVSQLCRMLFADVFAGGTYTPEEVVASLAEGTGREMTPVDGDMVTGDGSGEPLPITPGEEDLPEPLRSNPDDPISDAQRRFLFRLADERGMDDETMKQVVYAACGITSRKDLTRGTFEAAKRAVSAWEPPDPEDVPQRELVDMVPENVRAETRRVMETGEA